MAKDRCIVVDWGTTNVRAYRLAGDGRILERRESRQGIMNVADGGFRAALDALLADWRGGGDTPVVLSGMIGSRQGWVEAPYAECPVDARRLAQGLVPVPGLASAWIVPGVLHRGPGGTHDVMRGEEVQIFGALPGDARGPRTLCLPGTHSKWAVVEDGVLTRFATAMTGEVYQVLSEHSILRRLMPDGGSRSEIVPEAFRKGLDRSGQPGGLLNHLFGVRAEGLFGAIPADGLRSYLSGILIGHEVAALRSAAEGDAPVLLLGTEVLSRAYRTALDHFGVRSEIVDADAATVAGLTRIATEAGICRPGEEP